LIGADDNNQKYLRGTMVYLQVLDIKESQRKTESKKKSLSGDNKVGEI
jgi:hypothetical protein